MKLTVLGALVASVLFSCGGSAAPIPGELAASDKQRLTVAAPIKDVEATVAGNSDFAFDVYRAQIKGDDNLIFSPHSIAVALGMTYGGARNDTAKAFEQTMHIGIAPTRFHAAMNDLDLQLASRGANSQGKDGHPFKLAVTNQLFAQVGFKLLPDYLDLLAQEYGSNARLLDFVRSADPSRVKINSWVADKTEQRIKDLLPEGSVSDQTRLVLVNAVYFNASWAKPFEKGATSDQPFTHADGSTQNVPTMRNPDVAARAGNVGGVEVVELPYSGDELSMVLMMPATGAFASFESTLNASTLQTMLGALKDEALDLSMPRFTTRSNLPLGQSLAKLGLGVAFSSDADFSGMTGDRSLQVQDVVHQAFVAVDESGTEAAAATAVTVGTTSIVQTRAVHLDRAFVFVIRDLKTGAVVFAGRVMKI